MLSVRAARPRAIMSIHLQHSLAMQRVRVSVATAGTRHSSWSTVSSVQVVNVVQPAPRGAVIRGAVIRGRDPSFWLGLFSELDAQLFPKLKQPPNLVCCDNCRRNPCNKTTNPTSTMSCGQEAVRKTHRPPAANSSPVDKRASSREQAAKHQAMKPNMLRQATRQLANRHQTAS
jgi:hypothetical protein